MPAATDSFKVPLILKTYNRKIARKYSRTNFLYVFRQQYLHINML